MPHRAEHDTYEFITLLAAGAITSVSKLVTEYLDNIVGTLIGLATLGLIVSKIYLNIKKGRSISSCKIDDEKNKDIKT